MLRTISLIVGIFFSLPALAAIDPDNLVKAPVGLLPWVGSEPGDVLANMFSFGIKIAAVIAVMAITWAAIQMILASGNDEKLKKARHTMVYAIVGVVLAGLAFGIVQFITRLDLDTLL